MGTLAGIPHTQQPPPLKSLYDEDYYTWARQQADALRHRDLRLSIGKILHRRLKPWSDEKKAFLEANTLGS